MCTCITSYTLHPCYLSLVGACLAIKQTKLARQHAKWKATMTKWRAWVAVLRICYKNIFFTKQCRHCMKHMDSNYYLYEIPIACLHLSSYRSNWFLCTSYIIFDMTFISQQLLIIDYQNHMQCYMNYPLKRISKKYVFCFILFWHQFVFISPNNCGDDSWLVIKWLSLPISVVWILLG